MTIRTTLDDIHEYYRRLIPANWEGNVVHHYEHIKDISLPPPLVSQLDTEVQRIIEGPAGNAIKAFLPEGLPVKETVLNSLIHTIRHCYGATRDNVGGDSFASRGYSEIASHVERYQVSSPDIYVVVNFGPRTPVNPTHTATPIVDGWIDTEMSPLVLGVEGENEIHSNCRTTYKILPYSSTTIQSFNNIEYEIRCLMASYGACLQQPVVIRNVFVKVVPLDILPVEAIAFRLRGFNITVPDDHYFRSSAWVFQRHRQDVNSAVDYEGIRNWYAYLKADGDRLFRHEMLLSGFSHILLALHDNCIENRLRLASGLLTSISGLEGILLEGSEENCTRYFCQLGAALYRDFAGTEFCEDPDRIMSDADARRFFKILYRIRSMAAHGSKDISPHFDEVRAGSPLKQLISLLNIGGGFSTTNLIFAFCLTMRHVFAVLNARFAFPNLTRVDLLNRYRIRSPSRIERVVGCLRKAIKS